jgi:hypothetical protein
MKSIFFASTLAAALTSTSFGQVEVELISECCGDWAHKYKNEILTFTTSNNFGYTSWNIQVPEDTAVSFTLRWNIGNGVPDIFDYISSPSPFEFIVDAWSAEGNPNLWTGSFILQAGQYVVDFYEFDGIIDFNSELKAQGSCCMNSGCSSTGEATCIELGGSWTEGGSCDDCEPMADDCPADVDGDGRIGFSDVLIILNDWGACP